MTTAIEQAKREMYQYLNSVKCNVGAGCMPVLTLARMEESLETYLEQLRQQYEEMASTAHQRFESIQSLEKVNQDLIEQLANMTESRDMFRNLHQAATHAAIGYAGMPRTSGQDSGDRASCEQPDAKTMAVQWGGEGLPPIGAICKIEDRAPHKYYKRHVGQKVSIIAHSIGYNDEPTAVYKVFEGVDSEYHALVAGLFVPIKPIEQIEAEERDAAIQDLIKVTCISHGEAARIHDAGYRKPTCMHFFFATVGGQMKCTFCGVGK